MFDQLHLLRPWWLLTIIPCVVIVVRLWMTQRSRNNWQKICDPHLLPHLLQSQPQKSSRLPLLLLLIAWLAAAFAMSGPTWSRLPVPVYRSLAADVVLIDLSPTMYANDIKPSRLERAKFKLLDLLHGMKGVSAGLIAYSGEAYVVSPITEDASTIAGMVSELSPDIMPVAGNNLSMALDRAKSLIEQSNAKPANIMILTDDAPSSKALAKVKLLASQGIHTSVMGIGTATGAPIGMPDGSFMKDKSGNVLVDRLDTSALQRLAQAGNGIYVGFSNNNADVKALLAMNPTHADKASQSKQKLQVWLDQGRWFIILTALLSLLAFRKGWLTEIVKQ
tara:strand:- start:47075 stop:48079 length:1005 start_codon:yes stop_codon:yes gene_type:complete